MVYVYGEWSFELRVGRDLWIYSRRVIRNAADTEVNTRPMYSVQDLILNLNADTFQYTEAEVAE